MGYRDNFFVVPNMYGYTGNINENPTVYFMSQTEHGRITQYHPREANVGRDVVKTNEGYSIVNQLDDDGVMKCMEFEGEYRAHKSRGRLVLISETTTDDRALLSQSIWRHTELKKNRRRKSEPLPPKPDWD